MLFCHSCDSFVENKQMQYKSKNVCAVLVNKSNSRNKTHAQTNVLTTVQYVV